MKISQIICLLILTAITSLPAKATPSAEQQLKLYQELRAENYISEQDYQFKSRQLKAQIQLQNPRPMGPAGTSEISGQVLNAAVGLGGIIVRLYDVNDNLHSYWQATDPSGLYSFTNLPAGDYYLSVSEPTDDYVDAIWSSTGTQFCNYCEIPAQAIINLPDNTISAGHDLNLTVGATLTGQMVETGTGN